MEHFLARVEDRNLVRSRPRDPHEWDWLKGRGVPEHLLGPRGEGPGPVPRPAPSKGPTEEGT